MGIFTLLTSTVMLESVTNFCTFYVLYMAVQWFRRANRTERIMTVTVATLLVWVLAPTVTSTYQRLTNQIMAAKEVDIRKGYAPNVCVLPFTEDWQGPSCVRFDERMKSRNVAFWELLVEGLTEGYEPKKLDVHAPVLPFDASKAFSSALSDWFSDLLWWPAFCLKAIILMFTLCGGLASYYIWGSITIWFQMTFLRRTNRTLCAPSGGCTVELDEGGDTNKPRVRIQYTSNEQDRSTLALPAPQPQNRPTLALPAPQPNTIVITRRQAFMSSKPLDCSLLQLSKELPQGCAEDN